MRNIFLLVITIFGSYTNCLCQVTDSLSVKGKEIFVIRFDSTDIDSFYFKVLDECKGNLPNFIRQNSKKTTNSKINGASLISFMVDDCHGHAIRTKKALGYKDSTENRINAERLAINNKTKPVYCHSDTIYYSGDTLIVYSNIDEACYTSFIAEIDYKDKTKLNLLYKTYSDCYSYCDCIYGLEYKVLISGIKPKIIKIKGE